MPSTDFPGVYATIAELMWARIDAGYMTMEQFARSMEAYYRARVWEERAPVRVPSMDTPELRHVTVTAEELAAAAESQPGEPEPPAPEPQPEPQPEPPKPKAKVTDLAKKKTRIRAELEHRRETGTGLQDVVDASRGRVTMAMLLDALDAMPLTVAQWEDIGKAIKAAKIKKTWADKEAAPE